MLPNHIVDDVITRALREDAHYLDLSCEYLFHAADRSAACLVANTPGVLCGVSVFCRVFTFIEDSCTFVLPLCDGARFNAGDTLLELRGPTAALLQGERTALNLLQHLCGVATATSELVAAVAGTGAAIADTRKTLPGLRALQKYAVTCGGGRNHRYNLSDGVMLKDNHIDACGSIAAAAARVRAKVGHMVKLEVETRNLDEVQQALQAGADVIMLDNMNLAQLREAVAWVRAHETHHTPLEASGDLTLQNARAVAETGVDLLSLGAITHSVQAANISMRIKKSAI